MLSLADYDIRELIYEDDATIIYRGIAQPSRAPVVLKTLQRNPLPQHVARLRHEYNILSELNIKGVAHPLALIDQRGTLILALQDIGGLPLNTLIAQGPCPLMIFFPIALALVDIIDQIHRRRIIHRDIKPTNIIINQGSGQLQLIDFGLASRLSHEHPQLTPPSQLEGTLAYLAPEQTGRMNRPVDYRADYYALGVTLYELLTGQLPFVAQDALEWVHCQLARRPRPPHEIVPGLPIPLADIVIKLLAKLAEDRYQSAAGLRADLERCQREWEARGEIEPFLLGQNDISDRFQLPQRLYGREAEVATLLQAFERVATTGQAEIIHVAGYAGIGKSALVAELHKSIVAQRGYFISGKFDQYQRGLSYVTVATAFQGLIQQLLAEPAERIAQWRELLLAALENNGQMIVDLIPQLELIIGPQPPPDELPPDQAQYRLRSLFHQFVRVFATADHPLVLLLDDLQWMDTASLALLDELRRHPDTQHLLLLCAYRDNEVANAQPLRDLLESLRDEPMLTTITLKPLTEAHIQLVITDALHCDQASAAPLAQLVYAKTRGNPFFSFQFLTALYQDELLAFDYNQQRWAWDVEKIRARNFTDNVVELMLGELQRLPPATQHALTLAGFLGNQFDLATLALVSQQTLGESEAALWPALQMGLLTRNDARHRFMHDRIQEAAYALTPTAQRAARHLQIGRTLRDQPATSESDDQLMRIAMHLNAGAALLADPQERLQVAALNLRAGTKARNATVYATAITYLAAGMDLLPDDAWASHYELTYDLYRYRGECAFLTNDFASAEQLLDVVLQHARSLADRVHTHNIKLNVYISKGELYRARDAALNNLQELGVDLPRQPSYADVEHIYADMMADLGDRSIASLIDLPLMTDQTMQLAMRGLENVHRILFFLDRNLLTYSLCAMIRLNLRYGFTEEVIRAFSFLGWMLAGSLQQYKAGYEFVELSYQLMERYKVARYRGHVQLLRGTIGYWVQPIQTTFDPILDGFHAFITVGDQVGACYCCNQLVLTGLASGMPLEELVEEANRRVEFAQQVQYQDIAEGIQVERQCAQLLRGKTYDLTTFSDPTFDEAAFIARLTPDRLQLLICWYHVARMQAYCTIGNLPTAYEAMQQVKPLIQAIESFPQFHQFYYYGSLILTARYEEQAPEQQARDLATLQDYLRQLQIWAEVNPASFASTYALVAAEMARIRHEEMAAIHGYERAIQSARDTGFIQYEALANERASQFYTQRGLETSAAAYLQAAHDCYARWGAHGKLRIMEDQRPQLRVRPIQTSTTSSSTSMVQLDTLAIVKATQAISGKIMRAQLLQTLMQLVLEQAGAQFGALLLSDDNRLSLAASASVVEQDIQVDLQATDVDLPHSVIAYIQRSHERVLLDDTRLAHPFSADPYLAAQSPRSVLGLPILRQGELVGLLYLDHRSATHVFTLDRLTVLEQLAAQAAISLENTQLYGQLEEYNRTLELRVAERTDELNTALNDVKSANLRLEGLLRFARFLQHEVRGYAAGLEGLTPLLRQGFEEHPQASHYQARLDALENTVVQMNDLTQRMLILTREGTLPIQQQQTIVLLPLLQQVYHKARGFAEHLDMSIELILHCAPDLMLPGDALYLALAFYTGLRNAIEALDAVDHEAAQIEISAFRTAERVQVRIIDNGPGFPPALLEAVTVARQKEGGFVIGWSSKSGGSGLGLALMERVAQLHGGALEIGNRSDSPGAWISLLLPASPQA